MRKRLEFLMRKNLLTDNEVHKISSIDPTKNKMYTQWLLNLINKNRLDDEDYGKANHYLSVFHKHKNKLPVDKRNIDNIKSLSKLFNIISPYIEIKTRNENKREIYKETDFLHRDNNWTILIPLTERSSQFWGKGTAWCTAATISENQFNFYNNHGPLIIIITDKGDKFQYHPNFDMFMDSKDENISQQDKDYIMNYCYVNYKPLYYCYNMEECEDKNIFETVYCRLKKSIYFPEIKDDLKTYNLCKFAVENQYGMFLKFIPERFKTYEICELAVAKNNLMIKYVPQHLKTDKLCKMIINQLKTHNQIRAMLNYMPDDFKNILNLNLTMDDDNYKGFSL